MKKLWILAAAALVAAPALAEPLQVSAGQPLCIDQDSLATLIGAALAHLPRPAVACEFIKPGSTAQVVERYPSAAGGIRVVKARVTAPGGQPITGYTVDPERN